jgi:alpha/beta superfamily hydrolase
VLPEGRYDLTVPDGASLAVAVLHPHPDFGGDRFSPPVEAIHRACVAAGWAAVRFDFSSSEPTTAVDEVHAAISLLPAGVPVALTGYSFGAAISTQVLSPAVLGWALVAPPLTMLTVDAGPCGADARPKLVLVPEHDQFCPPPEAKAATTEWDATTLESIAGADHFLAGMSERVAARVVDYLSSLEV